MTTTTTHRADRRRWHAQIITDISPEVYVAELSQDDLQRAQLRAAVDQIAPYLPLGHSAEIVLWKTLATVTRRDQSWTVYRATRTGAVKVTR